MSVSDEQIAFARDLFSGLGHITTRRMFGGLGIYLDGRIFAIMMSDGVPKLKGVGPMAEAFDTAGWVCWTYTRNGKAAASMPYWTMPEALLEDPDAACDWARRSIAEL